MVCTRTLPFEAKQFFVGSQRKKGVDLYTKNNGIASFVFWVPFVTRNSNRYESLFFIPLFVLKRSLR